MRHDQRVRVLQLLTVYFALGTAFCTSETPTDDALPIEGEAGSPTLDTTTRTFAIDTLYLGEVDRNGQPDGTAWRNYGYDLDHRVSIDDFTGVCAPVEDGIDGIDNAAGELLLPALAVAVQAGPISAAATDTISKGVWTLLLQTRGLVFSPSTDQIDLQVFIGAAYGSPPTFDTSTNWPVRADSLVDNATLASGALVDYPNGWS
jgi:hypothetical protein